MGPRRCNNQNGHGKPSCDNVFHNAIPLQCRERTNDTENKITREMPRAGAEISPNSYPRRIVKKADTCASRKLVEADGLVRNVPYDQIAKRGHSREAVRVTTQATTMLAAMFQRKADTLRVVQRRFAIRWRHVYTGSLRTAGGSIERRPQRGGDC